MSDKEFKVRNGLIVGNNVLVANAISNTVTVSGTINASVIQVNGATIPSGATSNLIFDTVNTAFNVANAAFGSANNVAPQVAPAFNTANAAYTNSNTAFDVANAAFGSANNVAPQVAPAFNTANAGYTTANASYSFANGVSTNTTAAFGHSNLTYGAVNSAFGVINAAYGVANAAYGNANNLAISANAYAGAMANSVNSYTSLTYVKLTAGQQTITGDLNVTGNLTFLGNSTVVSSGQLSIGDSLIYLASNNYSGTDLVDIGFIANYGNTTAANVHTGLVRDATDKQYYLFQGYDREPANNTFVPGSNNMVNAVLVADFNTSNLTLGGANAIVWIKSAYDTVNAAYTSSNSDYVVSNAAFGVANAAYGQVNTLATSANAYASAVGTSTNNYTSATYSTLTQFGSVFGVANGAFGKANTALQNTSGTLAGSLHITGNETLTTSGQGKMVITHYDSLTRITAANTTTGGGTVAIGREPVVVHGMPAGTYTVEIWSGANGATRTMDITGGNVGIGNTAPKLKLEVAGNMSVDAFVENSANITTSYTITAGRNAMTAGPITVNSGVTVEVPSGSTWTVV